MALPHSPFGPLTTPQMSFLDDVFAALGNGLIIPCTASGTNAIIITPAANFPTVTAYSNYIQFSFTATASSTSAVTLQVGALPALNLYNPGGAVQSNNGDVVSAALYIVAYNASLNSNAGGFVIISASSTSSFIGGTLTSVTNMSGAAFNEAKANIASTGTMNIGGAAANYLFVTGNTNITSFDNVQAGTQRVLKFNSVGGVLTNNTAILMPGAASYTWQAGDCFIFESEGSSVWRCVAYALASGKALVGSGAGTFTGSFTSSPQTITAGGSLTLAHGLGAQPFGALAELHCTTPDNNYNIGDIAVISILGYNGSVSSQGVSVVPDATNLNIRFGSQSKTFGYPDKNSGAAVGLLNSSWQIVFKAWV